MTSSPAISPSDAVIWIQPVVAPRLSSSRVLRDVDRGAAIFAAQRNTLDDAQEDQQDRRDDARCRIGREHADEEGGGAHQADGGEERALAAKPVADDAEDDRSQRPEGEAGSKKAEGGDQAGGRVEPGEEYFLDGGRAGCRR